MLAGCADDFDHKAARRQMLAQDSRYGFAVARSGRRSFVILPFANAEVVSHFNSVAVCCLIGASSLKY